MGKRNCMIGFPNRIDGATLSGGSWARPLTKLKQRQMGDVARSANLAAASTFFAMDLGASRKIRAVDLRNHNFSLGAKVRIRGSNESSVTNLFVNSNIHTGWSYSGVAGSNNVGTAPDGTATASRARDTTANTSHYFERSFTGTGFGALADGQVFTFSTFIKSDGSRYVRLLQYYAVDGGSGRYAHFDLQAGTIIGSNSQSAKIEPYPDGWFRLSITNVVNQAEAYPSSLLSRVVLMPGESGTSSYAGGSTGVLMWGAMLNAGALGSFYPSGAAQGVRPLGYMDAWQTFDYDSGWLDAWPVVYPFGTLEWEDDNWWSGKYADEERAGYTAGVTHILPADTLARFWRVDISDPLNPAGFVQLGRVFIGPAWQPQNNMSFGAAIGWETTTEVQEAASGSEYFDVRTPFRVARFALDWMTEDEGMSNAFDLQRRAGVDKEVLWIHDPQDTTHALRRRFLGRLRQLSPVEFPYANVTRNAYEIKELL